MGETHTHKTRGMARIDQLSGACCLPSTNYYAGEVWLDISLSGWQWMRSFNNNRAWIYYASLHFSLPTDARSSYAKLDTVSPTSGSVAWVTLTVGSGAATFNFCSRDAILWLSAVCYSWRFRSTVSAFTFPCLYWALGFMPCRLSSFSAALIFLDLILHFGDKYDGYIMMLVPVP